jgi:hypothetical protein
MSAVIVDPLEDLFWAILRRFECAALLQYEGHAPELANPVKRAYVARLCERVPSDAQLEASDLAAPVRNLLGTAANDDEVTTLIVQGLFLEYLGRAIYRVASEQESMSPASRALSADGIAASELVVARSAQLLARRVPNGDERFTRFVDASRELVVRLDTLGEAVDQVFGEKFNLHFSDIMGDFTADLLPACVELGMTRRKVVAHLTGALMGF